MKLVNLKELFKNTKEYAGKEISIGGWLRSFYDRVRSGDLGMIPVIVGLLLAVFSTILGHSVFSWCLKYFSPSFVSASKLCEPIVAAVLAGFLFGELPVLLQIAGGALILGFTLLNELGWAKKA